MDPESARAFLGQLLAQGDPVESGSLDEAMALSQEEPPGGPAPDLAAAEGVGLPEADLPGAMGAQETELGNMIRDLDLE